MGIAQLDSNSQVLLLVRVMAMGLPASTAETKHNWSLLAVVPRPLTVQQLVLLCKVLDYLCRGPQSFRHQPRLENWDSFVGCTVPCANCRANHYNVLKYIEGMQGMPAAWRFAPQRRRCARALTRSSPSCR